MFQVMLSCSKRIVKKGFVSFSQAVEWIETAVSGGLYPDLLTSDLDSYSVEPQSDGEALIP